MHRSMRMTIAFFIVGSWCLLVPAAASPIDTGPFYDVWARTDGPVADVRVARTWIWGPEPISSVFNEAYQEGPDGKRLVQYLDKSRMEQNHAVLDADSVWSITTGRLAWELMTGMVQVGDDEFETRWAAEINVAGDPDDPVGPTYATMATLSDLPAQEHGVAITHTVDRSGASGMNADLAAYGVTAAHYEETTGHAVASVFWEFMHSTGEVWVDGNYKIDHLFQNPFYATGYPITGAYWTQVRVDGVAKLVLVQVFERRVLTYTPDNANGWKVEAGNVGRHYFEWRYQSDDTSAPEPILVPGPAPVDGGDTTTNEQTCVSDSENTSSNGTVKQSNSSTVTQSGGGNQTVVCEQTNTNVQTP